MEPPVKYLPCEGNVTNFCMFDFQVESAQALMTRYDVLNETDTRTIQNMASVLEQAQYCVRARAQTYHENQEVYDVTEDVHSRMHDDVQRELAELASPPHTLVVYANNRGEVKISRAFADEDEGVDTLTTLYSQPTERIRNMHVLTTQDGRHFLAVATKNDIHICLHLATIPLPYASCVLMYEDPDTNDIWVIGGTAFYISDMEHPQDLWYGDIPPDTVNVWKLGHDIPGNVQLVRQLHDNGHENFGRHGVYDLRTNGNFLLVLSGENEPYYMVKMAEDWFGANGNIYVFDLLTWLCTGVISNVYNITPISNERVVTYSDDRTNVRSLEGPNFNKLGYVDSSDDRFHCFPKTISLEHGDSFIDFIVSCSERGEDLRVRTSEEGTQLFDEHNDDEYQSD